jgi:Carboxypeptidase regulatory-like domain/TonB dependent receptor
MQSLNSTAGQDSGLDTSPVDLPICRVLRSSRVAKLAISALTLLFTAVIPMTTAHAQSTSASTVVGRVTDATGAVVPGATVHITDLATGLVREVQTNDSGDFTAPNLSPDDYSVRVEKTGFQTTSIASVSLRVGQTANLPIVLQIGSQTMTVEVQSTAAAELQTQDATVGDVMSEKEQNDLPLNGRNMLQLASLTAGVSAEDTADTGNPASSGGIGTRVLYVQVDGGRSSSTNYVLDGIDYRSVRFNTEAGILSVDAEQEFNVVRGVASTEYGQGTATMSMVTKSGGNQIHGSAYEFTRTELFDARNYFSTYTAFPRDPVYHRNQFGGTVGFPFIKDRLFGFAGYEQQASMQAQPSYDLFPTQAQLAAVGITNVSNPGTSSQLINVLLPTFATQGMFTPTATCVNNPSSCGGDNFEYGDNFVDDYTLWTGRMDETISSKQNMFERYVNYNSQQLTPSPFDVGENPVRSQNLAVGHTYVINSSMVNDLRLGWNYFYEYADTTSPYTTKSWTAMAGVTNVTGDTLTSEEGRPSLAITGFSTMGGDAGLGQGDDSNVFTIGDTMGIIKGKHSIRAGVQLQYRQDNVQAELDTNGAFNFSTLQNFANGICSTCQGSDGNSKGHYSDESYAVFGTDIWQLTPKLTVNYGMRWEEETPWIEKNNLQASFDFADQEIAFHVVPPACTATQVTFCIPTSLSTLGIFNTTPNYFPAGIVKPTRDRFAPRIGVAYQLTHGLVVRAGFGMYVENVNTNELQFTRNVTPFYITQDYNNVSVNGLFPSINTYVPNTANGFPAPFTTDPNNRLPYSYEQDFSIQQELGHQTLLEIAYTGSDTHLLWRRFDANEDLFGAGVPDTPATTVRPYHTFSHGMLESANLGHANFQGASIRIEQRPVHGFYYLGVYQFSKNEDDESGEADANDTSFSNNLEFDRALSNYDQRQRSSISGGYNLPFGQGQRFLQTGIANAIAGGWTIQPIVAIHSGFPFEVSNSGGTFGQYNAFRAFLVPGDTPAQARLSHRTAAEWYNATAFCSTQTLYGVAPQCPQVTAPGNGIPGALAWQGNFRRNTLIGPPTFQNDLSAIKNFHVHESITGQFRAEAFNITNHPIFANPNATETSATAGTITSTAADNRDLQFALKFMF